MENLYCTVDFTNFVDFLPQKSRVLSLAGDLVVVSRIALVFNYPIKKRFDHYAPSRFEDKEVYIINKKRFICDNKCKDFHILMFLEK